MNEASMLSKCTHPNIVKFYGYHTEEKFDEMEGDSYVWFYIVMEKMQKSLEDQI